MIAPLFVIALTVRTATFTATLPGTWEQKASQPDLHYVHGDDEVYISVVNLTTREEKEESERTAFRIADMRRKLVSDLSRGRATLTRMNKGGDSLRKMLWFSGEDPQNGKRLYVAVVAVQDAIVTTALYRPLSAPAGGFDELGHTIMMSVKDAR